MRRAVSMRCSAGTSLPTARSLGTRNLIHWNEGVSWRTLSTRGSDQGRKKTKKHSWKNETPRKTTNISGRNIRVGTGSFPFFLFQLTLRGKLSVSFFGGQILALTLLNSQTCLRRFKKSLCKHTFKQRRDDVGNATVLSTKQIRFYSPYIV